MQYAAGDVLDLDIPPGTSDLGRPAYPRRVRTALGRAGWWALTCPAFWICLIGAWVYGSLAVDKVDQHLAGSYDFGVIFQVIHGWAFHGYPSVPAWPASHGCVRLPSAEAPFAYDFMSIGTRVSVY